MAPLQQQIDARIAGIETALSIKLRKATRVRFELKRDGERTLAWVYYFGPAYDLHTLARAETVGEGLDAAMLAVLAMRSYEDECADLGIPVPHEAPAWLTGEDEAAFAERKDRARAAADLCP